MLEIQSSVIGKCVGTRMHISCIYVWRSTVQIQETLSVFWFVLMSPKNSTKEKKKKNLAEFSVLSKREKVYLVSLCAFVKMFLVKYVDLKNRL